MRSRTRRLAPAAMLALLGACATSPQWTVSEREPVGLPDRFQPDASAQTIEERADAISAPAARCWVHLVDPRTGTRLTLRQSAGGWGDYAVNPEGRYGVGARERLRVHCATGRGESIVTRGE